VIHAQYEAARSRAGLVGRADRGRIVVSGKDAASYLQGLLTNDIVALAAGEGCYAAYLTAQGRMISDMTVYQLGDVVLLSLARDVTPAVLGRLDQFVFSEDVQLGDVSDTFGSIAIVGPRAADIAASVIAVAPGAQPIGSLPEHGNVRGTFEDQAAIVLRISDTGEPGYELLTDNAQIGKLAGALRDLGAVDVDDETAEVLRVERGVPKFHRDMDEETIPLEAGIETRAINFNKGCYVGQEVIIRVLHRGHGRVARKLVGLTLAGATPASHQAPISSGDREVGQVTSSVFSPAVGRAIALGYVARDFVEPGTRVAVSGSEAVISALPFVA
jgi:folate-binding protein YgfZ